MSDPMPPCPSGYDLHLWREACREVGYDVDDVVRLVLAEAVRESTDCHGSVYHAAMVGELRDLWSERSAG